MVILTPDTKTCMSALLLTDSFDPYSFIEGEITTFAVFKVDGYLKKEFFEEAPSRAYSLWQDVRGYFFSIIKGKRTPLNFRLIFALSAGETEAFLRRNIWISPRKRSRASSSTSALTGTGSPAQRACPPPDSRWTNLLSTPGISGRRLCSTTFISPSRYRCSKRGLRPAVRPRSPRMICDAGKSPNLSSSL